MPAGLTPGALCEYISDGGKVAKVLAGRLTALSSRDLLKLVQGANHIAKVLVEILGLFSGTFRVLGICFWRRPKRPFELPLPLAPSPPPRHSGKFQGGLLGNTGDWLYRTSLRCEHHLSMDIIVHSFVLHMSCSSALLCINPAIS